MIRMDHHAERFELRDGCGDIGIGALHGGQARAVEILAVRPRHPCLGMGLELTRTAQLHIRLRPYRRIHD